MERMEAMQRRTIILLAISSMLLAGCFSPQTMDNRNKSISTMRIAAILPSSYWKVIQSALMSGAEGLDVDIKTSYPHTDFDIPQMTELIKAATAARVDAIIVQGIDDSRYLGALEAASEEGILVAFVDTDITWFSQHIYVGTDNYTAGRYMAEKLIERSSGEVNVAVLMGDEGFPNLDARLEGLRDGIAKNDYIHLLIVELTHFDFLETIEKYNDILKEEPSVNTIVCLDGIGAAAFSSVLGPSDTSSVKILCFDMSSGVKTAIKDGIIDGTIVQDLSGMGQKAVQELYQCFIGKQSLPVVIYTDITFIAAEQLEDMN